MRWLALPLALVGCFDAGSVRVGTTTPGPEAIAERTLTDRELTDLDEGHRLSFPTVFWTNGGKVVATVSYVTLPGRPEAYAHVLEQVTSIREWLPFNRSTEVVAREGDATIVTIAQGLDEPLQARFSLRIHRRGRVLVWELDASRSHDIRDIWGYVALRPHGDETLMTVAISVDLGEGMLRDVLEREVHSMMGFAVDDARDYFASQWRDPCRP